MRECEQEGRLKKNEPVGGQALQPKDTIMVIRQILPKGAVHINRNFTYSREMEMCMELYRYQLDAYYLNKGNINGLELEEWIGSQAGKGGSYHG